MPRSAVDGDESAEARWATRLGERIADAETDHRRYNSAVLDRA